MCQRSCWAPIYIKGGLKLLQMISELGTKSCANEVIGLPREETCEVRYKNERTKERNVIYKSGKMSPEDSVETDNIS